MSFKAVFLPSEKPYDDIGDVLEIARSVASKILGSDKVKVLNILQCNYPLGYVAVVQNSGGKRRNKEKVK